MSRPGASAAPAAPRRRRLLIASVVVWVVILLVAVFAWQWLSGMDAIRRSDVYTEAVGRAGSHPQVLGALGQPVEPGWWVRGRIDPQGPSGRAWLRLPLAGSEGRGRLAAEARRQGWIWRFDRLEVALPDGTVIDLLAAPHPPDDVPAVAAAAVADELPGGPAPPPPAGPAALAAAASNRTMPPRLPQIGDPPPPLPPPPSPAPPAPWHDVRIERRS